MKKLVKQIVENNLTRLTDKIRKVGLWPWVESRVPVEYKNKLSTAEMIYVSLNPKKSPFCSAGNKKYFYNQEKGFGLRCGDLSCSCRQEFLDSDLWQKRTKKAKKKRKKTFRERHNCDNPSQCEEFQNKKIVTNNENLGVDWPGQSKICQGKAVTTHKENTGYDYNFQTPGHRDMLRVYRKEHNDEMQEKVRQTNLRERGVEWSFQDPIVKQKIEDTVMLRYKVKRYSQSELFKKQNVNTCLTKYGCTNVSQRHFSKDQISFLYDKDRLKAAIEEFGVLYTCEKYNIPIGSAYYYAKKYGIDTGYKNHYEMGIKEWLNEEHISFKQHERKILNRKELDFYFPEINFAIEFQGDYWHCNPDIFAEDFYHEDQNLTAKEIWIKDQYKRDLCKSKNIELFEIWELDWNINKNFIKEQILQIIKEKYNELNTTTG